MFFHFLLYAEIKLLYYDSFDLSKLKRFNYFTLTLIKITHLSLFMTWFRNSFYCKCDQNIIIYEYFKSKKSNLLAE